MDGPDLQPSLFLPYGLVYKAGVFYYAMLVGNLLPFCLMASSVSVLMVMLVAVCLPAGRIRTVFIFLGLFLFLVLLFSFRLIRPERFARPESFMTVMSYLQTLESSHSPCLPTTWFFDSLRAALSGKMGSAFFHSALSWSCAIAMIFVATWVSGGVYFKGLSKAQTVPRRCFSHPPPRRWRHGLFLNLLSGPARALTGKEIKTFFRDQTQWSQVFLILALIVIYLYNFSVLPIEGGPRRMRYLQNLLSFLNMGLAAFVLSAVSARFVFPAVSLEGDAFWIVKCSPVSIRTFLWIKFFIYWVPLLLLAELLIVVTNVLLQVTPFMMVLSIVTTFLVVPGIISMGIGLGAVYPDFQSENPAQSVTSLGGLIYMTLCIGFTASVIILEAGPVYSIMMTGIRGGSLRSLQWFWLVGSFSVVLVLCLLAVVIPMRIGERRISHYERAHYNIR
jgi:ABC-2 type transport system permease protein